MKRKETRRLLRKWARADSEIATLYDVIKTIVDEIDAVGDLHAQNLDGMPHAPTVGRPTEQAAVKRITLADRYRGRLAEANRKIEDLERFKDRIEGALLWTSADEDYVVRMRYKGRIGDTKDEPNPLPFSKIAENMNLTERRVKQIEASAVSIIGDYIDYKENK